MTNTKAFLFTFKWKEEGMGMKLVNAQSIDAARSKLVAVMGNHIIEDSIVSQTLV